MNYKNNLHRFENLSVEKEVIVLLHGFGFNSNIMQPLAEQLHSTHHVVVIDLPGYGDNINLTFPDNLNDLTNSVMPQIPEEAILIGWSLGGLLALQLQQHSTKVKKTILLASSPCFIEKNNWPGMSEKIFDLFYNQIEKNPASGMEMFLYLNVQGLVNEKTEFQLLKQHWLTQLMPEKITLLNSLKILKESDLRDIGQNAHYILSERDQLINPQIIKYLNPLSAVSLAEQGHAIHFSNTSLVANHILRIINEF
ncbi:MAG: alpha/beta fold hydrolase [Legionellales bacterium]|nr:alpha/beta fold hydrolase [Legionellales bacterium]